MKKEFAALLKRDKEDGTFEKCNKNLLGLRDDDDWILNALYADNTQIRDQLCVDLWNEVGAKDQLYGYNYGVLLPWLKYLSMMAIRGFTI